MTPPLPQPSHTNWRKCYRGSDTDLPKLSAYQPPKGNPIPFILDTFSVSGGQSVETVEFPFFGGWANNPLNKKPYTIELSGFLRGLNYIENRIKLIEALSVVSSDDSPGYLELPLWGRFPVVEAQWKIEEGGIKGGQCSISLSFVSAGVSENERITTAIKGQDDYSLLAVRDALAKSSVESFSKFEMAKDTLSSAFNSFKGELLSIVGRVQGTMSALNKMTNEVQNISNLIAQGVTAPHALANALFAAVASITASIAQIKEAIEEPVSFLLIRDNAKNALRQFFLAADYKLPIIPLTVQEQSTKEQCENLYKTCAFFGASELLPVVEATTYKQLQELWILFERLEDSIKKDDTSLYTAIDAVRIAVSKALIAKKAAIELSVDINSPMPLLALSQYLGCDDAQIRRLNRVENSFFINGEVTYV